MTEWESKSAMLAHLSEGGTRTLVVGKEAEAPRRFYTFSMGESDSRLEIGVMSSGLGAKPAVVLLGGGQRVIVGHDISLTWVDTVSAKRVKTKRLSGVFFEFLPTGSDHDIVAVHELGAARVNRDGTEVWSVVTDVVEDFNLDGRGNLVLTIMDQGAKVYIEMASGRVVRAT